MVTQSTFEFYLPPTLRTSLIRKENCYVSNCITIVPIYFVDFANA